MKINCHKRMIEYMFHRVKEEKENGVKWNRKKEKGRNQRNAFKGFEGRHPILKLQIEKCRGKRRSLMAVLER